MNKLIIVGAGGFGREALQWALQSNDNNVKWKIVGFVSDNLDILQGKNCAFPILGRALSWQPKSDERFVIAIANPKHKEMLVDILTTKGAIFENIIHRTAILFPTTKLGQGVILCPHVIVSDSVVIGNHVMINNNSCIGHDTYVGDYTTINSLCDITGNVSVGKGVFISSSVNVTPRCNIGDHAYICAGSVVVNNIRQNTRVFGVPARKFEIKTT